MSNTNWIFALLPKVFTKVKTEFSQTIKDKYSMTAKNFSTEDAMNVKPVFPFVWIQQISCQEVGNDIDNTDINAVNVTFQIETYDSDSASKAKECMTEAMRIMKSMRFNVLPDSLISTKDDGLHRVVMRFSRIIAYNDII